MQVVEFSMQALKDLLKVASGASPALIDAKGHTGYFDSYFQTVCPKRIVVEPHYTDRDFLQDFSAYYVRCFEPYERTCTRLHFFSSEFSTTDLDSVICGEPAKLTEEELRSSYLGFIVVKPLPQTYIGRTCLEPFPSDNNRRCFPIVRTYEVSMFGLSLEVESLAFQEQDQVAGACATSALWSIFQGTGVTFQHYIPSPVEVSNFADKNRGSEYRRAPSRGLSDQQAIEAIRGVGLEPLEVGVKDRRALTSNVYAYLRGRVPTYLGVSLFDVKFLPGGKDIDGSSIITREAHAVAVTGFSLGGAAEVPDGASQFRLRATRVDKIYAHDDQVGPFARMAIRDCRVLNAPNPPKEISLLDTSLSAGKAGFSAMALPDVLLIPLYHKIRIPFSFVQHAIVSFDAALKVAMSNVNLPELDSLIWDIFLTTSSDCKREARNCPHLNSTTKLEFCTKPLPRYMWKASLEYKAAAAMTIFFDATDLEQGNVVVHVLEDDAVVCALARTVAADPNIRRKQELTPQWRVWDWFNKHANT
jgi:hypothetical protein